MVENQKCHNYRTDPFPTPFLGQRHKAPKLVRVIIMGNRNIERLLTSSPTLGKIGLVFGLFVFRKRGIP